LGKTLYRYQREDGVIVTTNDFDNVPEKYRKSVEKIVEPDENPITLKMKENVAKGWPGATGFTFWKSEFPLTLPSPRWGEGWGEG
jgi:hypothetical protein